MFFLFFFSFSFFSLSRCFALCSHSKKPFSTVALKTAAATATTPAATATYLFWIRFGGRYSSMNFSCFNIFGFFCFSFFKFFFGKNSPPPLSLSPPSPLLSYLERPWPRPLGCIPPGSRRWPRRPPLVFLPTNPRRLHLGQQRLLVLSHSQLRGFRDVAKVVGLSAHLRARVRGLDLSVDLDGRRLVARRGVRQGEPELDLASELREGPLGVEGDYQGLDGLRVHPLGVEGLSQLELSRLLCFCAGVGLGLGRERGRDLVCVLLLSFGQCLGLPCAEGRRRRVLRGDAGFHIRGEGRGGGGESVGLGEGALRRRAGLRGLVELWLFFFEFEIVILFGRDGGAACSATRRFSSLLTQRRRQRR